MPAPAPTMLVANDASESDDEPQSSGTNPPTSMPNPAQRPITERPMRARSASGRRRLRWLRESARRGLPSALPLARPERARRVGDPAEPSPGAAEAEPRLMHVLEGLPRP